MADDDIELGNALDGGSSDEIGESKKKRFISDKIDRILVYIILGIIAVLLTVNITGVLPRIPRRMKPYPNPILTTL